MSICATSRKIHLDHKFNIDQAQRFSIDQLFHSHCCTGTEDCPGVPYESMRDAMVALQGSVLKDQLGQLAGHVVECESVEDVRKFKVRESCQSDCQKIFMICTKSVV